MFNPPPETGPGRVSQLGSFQPHLSHLPQDIGLLCRGTNKHYNKQVFDVFKTETRAINLIRHGTLVVTDHVPRNMPMRTAPLLTLKFYNRHVGWPGDTKQHFVNH
jgi:hypothetical protein